MSLWRRKNGAERFAQAVVEVVNDWRANQRRKRAEARLDAHVEMHERAALPCPMCDEIGEPHVCERQWWRDKIAHTEGRGCSDPECPCHESLRLKAEAADLWPVSL